MQHLSHSHDHESAMPMLSNVKAITGSQKESAFAAFLLADQHMTRIYSVRPASEVHNEPIINQSSR